MSDRPDEPADGTERPEGEGRADDELRADDAAGAGPAGDSPGDAWAVSTSGQTRPPMGFSPPGGAAPASRPAQDEDDDEDDFGEIGQMLQQLLGGAGGGMPDLSALMKQLGGAGGQLPDLSELMKQFGGSGGPGGGGGIEQLWKQLGIDPSDPATMGMLQAQMRQFFSPATPADRMQNETELARRSVAASSDPTPSAAQQRDIAQAVQVANLWIDPVTTLDSPHGQGVAWSRAEWIEATMPTWHRLVEPVAQGVTTAMTDAMDAQFERLKQEGLGDASASDIPGLEALGGLNLGDLIGQLQPALRQLAAGVFSAQLGNGIGALAADVLSGTEVGLPLLGTEDVALLPTNIAAFTEGLTTDAGEALLYLAVREATRTRLFAEVPWLGPQLEAAVRDYAHNIRIDTDAIEEQVRSMDVQNPAAIQEALQDKLFSPTPTPAQQAALGRLETSLALVEGWVDLVAEQAAAPHLPHADALGEVVRRRRAGGPAEKTFSGLVGLELRPRRLKDAKNLWAALEDAGGTAFRDAPWQHPDFAPTGADLDDPLGYVERRRAAARGGDDLDSALNELLRGEEGGESRPTDSPG